MVTSSGEQEAAWIEPATHLIWGILYENKYSLFLARTVIYINLHQRRYHARPPRGA